MTTFPTLTSKRLVLRQWGNEDLERVLHILGNANVARMLTNSPSPFTIADARNYVASRREGTLGGAISWAITLDGLTIGGCSFLMAPPEPTFGYWLDQDYWCKGYAREAVTEALKLIFQSHPTLVFYPEAYTDNASSRSLLLKLGAKDAGWGQGPCKARGPEPVSYWVMALDKASFEASLKSERAA